MLQRACSALQHVRQKRCVCKTVRWESFNDLPLVGLTRQLLNYMLLQTPTLTEQQAAKTYEGMAVRFMESRLQ